jgi:stage II sporulation protein D
VAVVQDAVSLNLRVDGPYQVIDLNNSNKLLYKGEDLKTTVTAYKNGISLGEITSRGTKVSIKVPSGSLIVINGRSFRDEVRLIRKENGRLLVINKVEVDDYLKGILYHEVSHYWPMEILKAQAIVCRSYALYQARQNINKDFDVTCDVYSQVYGGQTSERYRTTKAVEQTKGLVLVYQHKLIPAYFHSTCGGQTEEPNYLWNMHVPYSRSVACPFCRNSPHFSWHIVLSLSQIKDKLQEAGYKLRPIKEIQLSSRNNSGRINELTIIAGDDILKLSGKDFRNFIGPNLIRSTNFTVSLDDGDAVFEGLGWGHGVGLCQWGGYFMAKAGWRYREILKYYYPGTQISSLAE